MSWPALPRSRHGKGKADEFGYELRREYRRPPAGPGQPLHGCTQGTAAQAAASESPAVCIAVPDHRGTAEQAGEPEGNLGGAGDPGPEVAPRPFQGTHGSAGR